MSNNFEEKLKLYKENKLDSNERLKIEEEIKKFLSISDYLNEEEIDFLEDLKQQMLPNIKEETKRTKVLKRKLNLRIIFSTALSTTFIFVTFIIMYLSASKVTSSLFALNTKEVNTQRETMIQFAQMFLPQYKPSESNVTSSLFAKQNISICLQNNVGHTEVNKTDISVQYSFGKPIKGRKAILHPSILDSLSYLTNHESNRLSGFRDLEKAPQGTKSKIFIEFTKALTAEEIKTQFVNNINSTESQSLDITPIAVIGSQLVLANPSYYQLHREVNLHHKQLLYESMDNEAHKESLIANLILIKNNLKLLQAMYFDKMFEDTDFYDLVNEVEKNGAQYLGIYIVGDSKELLKLQEHPYVHCIQVENIVIW